MTPPPSRGALDDVRHLPRGAGPGRPSGDLYAAGTTVLHLRLDERHRRDELQGRAWPAQRHVQRDVVPDCRGGGPPEPGRALPHGAAGPHRGERLRDLRAGRRERLGVSFGEHRRNTTIVSYKEAQACGFALALNDDGTSQYPVSIRVQGAIDWQKAAQALAVPLEHLGAPGRRLRRDALHLYRDGAEVAVHRGRRGVLKQCTGNTAIGSRSSHG